LSDAAMARLGKARPTTEAAASRKTSRRARAPDIWTPDDTVVSICSIPEKVSVQFP
jgi:hypothetical protein